MANIFGIRARDWIASWSAIWMLPIACTTSAHSGSFPAVINLSTLDGTNGFWIVGTPADESGFSVSGAGDVNRDGLRDVIIGAPRQQLNSEAGSSYVVFGKRSGYPKSIFVSRLNGRNGFRVDGAEASDRTGDSVRNAGDVNDDGIADVIIGAPQSGDNAGAANVLFGKAAGFPATVDLFTLKGNGFKFGPLPRRLGLTGDSVAGAGDVNRDGFADVIIGAPFFGTFGSAFVVFGASNFPRFIHPAELNGSNGLRLVGEQPNTGVAVAGLDINGDGARDMIVGSAGSAGFPGTVYVVFGKKTGFAASIELSSLDGSNGFRIDGGAADGLAGWSVAAAGDVNGDGLPDLIIGGPGASPNGNASGSSYVVFGRATPFPAVIALSSLNGTNGFRIDGERAEDYCGLSVARAGDVNNDGIDDVIIGAPSWYNDAVRGKSYVVFGRTTAFPAAIALSSLDGTNGFRLNGARVRDRSGTSVAGAGDVNGDGVADILIGAPGVPSPFGDKGRSYVVFGRP